MTETQDIQPISLAPVGGEAEMPVELTPLDSSQNIQPPSLPLAKERTFKTEFGLGKTLGKTADEIHKDILNGYEQGIRQQAAASLDHKKFMDKQQVLTNMANQNQGPLSRAEVAKVLDPFNPNNEPVDPDSVIERYYAKGYVSSVSDAAASMKNTVLDKARKEIPEQVARIEDKAEDSIARIEYAKKVLKNMDEEVRQQSWLGWSADVAKQFFQPYVEYKLRGNISDVGLMDGVLLGNNLQKQADSLFGKPFKQFKQELDAITSRLKADNPQLARQFANYVVGVSASDKMLDNVFTGLAPADVAAVAKGGANLILKGSLFNSTNKAFKDAVKKASLEDGLSKSAIAEASGDLQEAAIQKTIENVAEKKKLTAAETLTSNMRLDRNLYSTNPGSLSRDEVLILENQSIAAETNLQNALNNNLRVNRAIGAMDTPEKIRALNDWVKTLFKGQERSILDIKDPVWDNATATWMHPVELGTENGNLFRNPDVAKYNAELRGFAEPQIVESKGTVEVGDPGLAGPKRDLMRKPQIEQALEEGIPKAIKKWKEELKNATTDAAKAEAKQQLKFFQDTQKKYKKDLEEINKRIFPTPPQIEQDGLGYKMVINVPMRENTDTFFKQLATTPEGQSTGSLKGGFRAHMHAALGWISGADLTLSKYETMQRKVATYSKNSFEKWLYEEGQYIRQVTNGEVKFDPVTGEPISALVSKPKAWFGLGADVPRGQVAEQFNEVLNYAKTGAVDEQGRPGAFFKTPGALEDHYMRVYKRKPTFQEHQAYFAYVRTIEGERAYYEIAEYRNRSIRGAQQHKLDVLGPDKQKVESPWFDAVQEVKFPRGTDNIAIMDTALGEERVYRLDRIPTETRARFEEAVEKGEAKVIRIWNPGEYPLKEFSPTIGNRFVRYIYTKNLETKPLEFNHVNRRGGGHFDYDYKNYIKMGDMREDNGTWNYFGDNTLMPIENIGMGQKLIKRMEAVMDRMRNNDYDGARALAEGKGTQLPWDFDDFKAMFEPKRGPNGEVIPPQFSLDVRNPFRIVSRGRGIHDIDDALSKAYGKAFNDLSKTGSDAAQFNVSWNRERDAELMYTIVDKGSKDIPHFEMTPAKMVDPIATLNRSLQRAINSTFMDDYKYMAIDQWLKEATPYFRDSDAVRTSPFWYFRYPDWKPDAPKHVVSNLMSNRLKINNFVGTPDVFDTWLHGMTQDLLASAYNKYGAKENRNVYDRIKTFPIDMLDRVGNPTDYIRSTVFNFKLGLFSIPQFLVQAQAHATIWALSPVHGTVGTFGSLLHTWGRFTKNPEILAKLDEYYTKLGIGSRARPGEFLEAMKEAEKTGFFHVAGEHAVRDDVGKPNFIGNDFGSFLSLGQVFFKEGERSVRQTAWYTAFREWREKNPLGAISNVDRQKILDRADLLTNNMSRASNSILHTGPAAITTQFLSYQIRLAEMFVSKRIGMADRAKLLGMYGALYGLPASLGITGLPISDVIRQEMIDRGYNVGENWWKTMLMEGIPSWATGMITGGLNPQKGDYYNFSNRYSAQGFTFIREAMRSDTTVFKLLGGAGLSTIANTISSTDNFMRAMMSYFRSNENEVFPLTANDFLDIFKEISSVNQAWKVYAAINTGKWLSKQEGYIADVSTLQALFMGVTGLDPQERDDMFLKSNIKKGEQNYQKYLEKEFIKEHLRGIQAAAAGDWEASSKAHTRARAILEMGGFPIDQRAALTAKANKRSGKMGDTLDYNFALDKVPTKKWFQSNVPDTRLEQYRTKLKMQQEKENR